MKANNKTNITNPMAIIETYKFVETPAAYILIFDNLSLFLISSSSGSTKAKGINKNTPTPKEVIFISSSLAYIPWENSCRIIAEPRANAP